MTVRLGSNRSVACVFERCRAQRRAAFIPYLMAGDPEPEASMDLIAAAAEGGADLIEIGIPYSDPLADGPTIQRASVRALSAGMSFDRALELARRLSGRLNGVPLIGFAYYNPVLAHGLEKTARDFGACGFSGIIVPDLPLNEAAGLLKAFIARQLAVTLLVAPTTPAKRAAAIASLCTDFVYVVSRMGVTGAQTRAFDHARSQIERLRTLTNKPLALGFGVASPNDAAEAATFADGVIVGSALIDRISTAKTTGDAVESVKHFCSDLARHCRREERVPQETGK